VNARTLRALIFPALGVTVLGLFAYVIWLANSGQIDF
jgi:nitrate reductase NapE component